MYERARAHGARRCPPCGQQTGDSKGWPSMATPSNPPREVRRDLTSLRQKQKAPSFHLGLFSVLAERRGFEPRIGYEPIHAFQACDFNHSSISPAYYPSLGFSEAADYSKKSMLLAENMDAEQVLGRLKTVWVPAFARTTMILRQFSTIQCSRIAKSLIGSPPPSPLPRAGVGILPAATAAGKLQRVLQLLQNRRILQRGHILSNFLTLGQHAQQAPHDLA